MLPKITCCNGCTPETGRHSGCHSTCEKYIKERDEYERLRQQIAAEREKSKVYTYYLASRNKKGKQV